MALYMQCKICLLSNVFKRYVRSKCTNLFLIKFVIIANIKLFMFLYDNVYTLM